MRLKWSDAYIVFILTAMIFWFWATIFPYFGSDSVVFAQRGELTEGEYFAVWDKKAGEVNIAFRDGAAAFDAVTLTLDTLRQTNPTAAQTLARDIARNLGVIGASRELGDDAIEDREAFREFRRGVNSLPFSEVDRQSLIDSAKSFTIVTEF